MILGLNQALPMQTQDGRKALYKYLTHRREVRLVSGLVLLRLIICGLAVVSFSELGCRQTPNPARAL